MTGRISRVGQDPLLPDLSLEPETVAVLDATAFKLDLPKPEVAAQAVLELTLGHENAKHWQERIPSAFCPTIVAVFLATAAERGLSKHKLFSQAVIELAEHHGYAQYQQGCRDLHEPSTSFKHDTFPQP